MRYMFFDIECCNGRDICEFGYIITDDKFNILEKKDTTINPENKFNLIGRPGHRDLYLCYDESVYYKSYKFPYYYDEIKKLIEHTDQIVVGYAISNDVEFLNSACRRYKLDPINFKFIDTQKIYAEFVNIKDSISLENAGESLNIEKPKYLHKSDDDSELTMNLVKNMCKDLNCTFEELIKLCDSCSGRNENSITKYDNPENYLQKTYEAVKNGNDNTLTATSSNYKMFFRFLQGVKPQGEIIKSSLNGKTLCLSLNYEMTHFKEMLSLIQLLANHKAKYIKKASESDIFITYYDKNKPDDTSFCKRLKYVQDAIKEGKQIQIMSFDELLNILGINEKDLSTMPFPEISSFYKKPKRKNNGNKKLTYETKIKEQTIGDLYPELLTWQK